jgi:hypothetical protein
MDASAYWQENKRFVLTVGAGALVFLAAFAIEGSMFDGPMAAARKEIQGHKNRLKEAKFTASDLATAEQENEALKAAAGMLVEAARFRPRPDFVPDPSAGPAAHHYLRTSTRVKEELGSRASRAGVALDRSLGLPELSPTNEGEIVRYLEALDLVESVADLAVRARVQRIEKIQVRLDPAMNSKQGVGTVERTKVQMSLAGNSLAVTRLLSWTQRPDAGGRVFAIDKLELALARGKKDEVRLDVTFVVPRIKELELSGEVN